MTSQIGWLKRGFLNRDVLQSISVIFPSGHRSMLSKHQFLIIFVDPFYIIYYLDEFIV